MAALGILWREIHWSQTFRVAQRLGGARDGIHGGYYRLETYGMQTALTSAPLAPVFFLDMVPLLKTP